MTYQSSLRAVGIEFDDAALEATVRQGLQVVESALQAAVRSEDEFVADVAKYLVDAGGKRFRPLLTLLAAQFGDAGADTDAVVMSAVVCELTHLATLYHDDVMDEATVRRGATAANTRWSNTIAILTGDFLFARASDILADLGPEAVRIQARTFERLVTGQIRETVGPKPGVDPIEHYLSVLADKTGSLIATAAEFGARFAGVDEQTVDCLRAFGEQFGIAFQISDDILDIASDTGQSGKTPGTDLREGVQTLPVLYALQGTDPAGQRLRELVSRPLADDCEHAEALSLLRSSEALEQARHTMLEYADSARATIAGLPELPATAALRALADLVVLRSG
ncbi:polyprenyl synthetase family protein [Jatrophihabitans sp.]|uniref:polyprenyl synthetase family protein n=1 Tax=Jatrophihabitans sp. TaxID=1932789 RepID=UPI002CD0F81F|nr:polyprenyl synthetase family protein [Jatrophihabitans sp.]